MSEREDWINLIHNEYDPRPNLGKADYSGFEWDDGTGRIADAIMADKVLALREAADRIEALEEALAQAGPKQLKLAEKYERILDRAKTMRRTSMEMRVFEDDMEIIISALRAARPPAAPVETNSPEQARESDCKTNPELTGHSPKERGERVLQCSSADIEPVAWRHKHWPNEPWQYRDSQTFGTPYPYYEQLYNKPPVPDEPQSMQAADRIEALEAALREIAGRSWHPANVRLGDIARAALASGQDS